MILGNITGKITTTEFTFKVEGPGKKFEYIEVQHPEYGTVLAQIIELERHDETLSAKCVIIGYKDKDGKVKQIRTPLEPETPVETAYDDTIRGIIKLVETKGAYIGKLEGRDIKVFLDLKKLLTKHVAVLAKSGAGKSYSVGVLLEEIIERKVPLLIIDPHGEYKELKHPNDNEEDIKLMKGFEIEPRGYARMVQEYGDQNTGTGIKTLKLNEDMSINELLHLIPAKLNNTQLAIIYNAAKRMEKKGFSELQKHLELEENPAKIGVINIISQLEETKLFSTNYTPYNELIQNGKCSIINLKGISPEIQEIIVYKLLRDLFEARKKGTVPPFFCVIEEAHNFCPERSYGETKASGTIRTIASEGRKFGMGLCVITQRPARIEKNVISQCTTQIILKVTNPNDLKALTTSVEGINADTEEEIKNLPIGTALVTGVVDIPLLVNIRPRKTRHGGRAIEMIAEQEEEKVMEEIKEYKEKSLLPIIGNAHGDKLIPAALIMCEEKGKEYAIIVNLTNGSVVTDIDEKKEGEIPHLEKLSQIEVKILKGAYYLKEFDYESLVKKTGVGLAETQKILKKLTEMNYIIKTKEGYSTNPEMILSKLKAHAINNQIEYLEMGEMNRVEKKVNLDNIKKQISKFTNVKDIKECWMVR